MNRRTCKQERIHNYGEGLRDVFKSMVSSVSKKIGSEASKKITESAFESALKAAAVPVGKKTGEIIVSKVFDKDEPKNEQKINGGPKIDKELQKIYVNNDNNDIKSDISKKLDELL